MDQEKVGKIVQSAACTSSALSQVDAAESSLTESQLIAAEIDIDTQDTDAGSDY